MVTLTSDSLYNAFQNYWTLILNHKELDANEAMDELTKHSLDYADKLWDKIMNVSEQVDFVD